MAALGPTITAEDLTLAGITGTLNTALLGLTWTEAKAKLSAIIGLTAGNEAIQRGAVATYTVNGRSVTASLQQIKTALEAVRSALANAEPTGGLTFLPVEFRA